MINIAICDYNKEDIKTLIKIIEKFCLKKPEKKIKVHSYTNTSSLMDTVEKGNLYDIYLLDILMPGTDGIQLCKFLRYVEKDATIMFITKSKEFALEAYKLNVAQYLIKPVEEEKLIKILEKEIESLQKRKEKMIKVNSKEGIKRISYCQIVFIDTKSHIAFFHLNNGQTIETKTLRQSFNEYTKEIQKDKRFLRPHYSFLINIDYVEKMTIKEFEMTNGKKIPISKSKLNEVKEEYTSYK